jgi:hypothetical protein
MAKDIRLNMDTESTGSKGFSFGHFTAMKPADPMRATLNTADAAAITTDPMALTGMVDEAEMFFRVGGCDDDGDPSLASFYQFKI